MLIDGKGGQSISFGVERYINFEDNFPCNDGKHILIDNDALRKEIEPNEQIEADGGKFYFKDLKWSEDGSTLYFATETFENSDIIQIRV